MKKHMLLALSCALFVLTSHDINAIPTDANMGDCKKPTETTVCNPDVPATCANLCSKIEAGDEQNVQCAGASTGKQCWYWTEPAYGTKTQYYMYDANQNKLAPNAINQGQCATCSDEQYDYPESVERTCFDAELGSSDCLTTGGSGSGS